MSLLVVGDTCSLLGFLLKTREASWHRGLWVAAKGSVKAAIDPAKALLEECGISCMNYPLAKTMSSQTMSLWGDLGNPASIRRVQWLTGRTGHHRLTETRAVMCSPGVWVSRLSRPSLSAHGHFIVAVGGVRPLDFGQSHCRQPWTLGEEFRLWFYLLETVFLFIKLNF